MSEKRKAIPRFANEAAERTFWERHDSASYVDWRKAKSARFPNLKRSTRSISSRFVPESRPPKTKTE
jgi:hypothetical protein